MNKRFNIYFIQYPIIGSGQIHQYYQDNRNIYDEYEEYDRMRAYDESLASDGDQYILGAGPEDDIHNIASKKIR